MSQYIHGDKELIDKLSNLKKTDAKAALRKGTRAGCKIVQARAKELAPQRTGQLARGLKVRAMPRSRKYVGTMLRLADTGEVFYGSFLEYGTKYIKPRGFLKQASEDAKVQACDVAAETTKDEIERRIK